MQIGTLVRLIPSAWSGVVINRDGVLWIVTGIGNSWYDVRSLISGVTRRMHQSEFEEAPPCKSEP